MKKLIRGAGVVGVVLLMVPAPTTAQQVTPVAVSVGSRVRVFAPSLRRDRFVGRVDSLSASDVFLDTAGVRRKLGFESGPVLVDEFRKVSIRRSAIDRIDVSGGRTTRSATIKGVIFGGVAGALLFGFGNLPQVNPKTSDFFKHAPLGLVVGGILGGVVGYALGGERWVPGSLGK